MCDAALHMHACVFVKMQHMFLLIYTYVSDRGDNAICRCNAHRHCSNVSMALQPPLPCRCRQHHVRHAAGVQTRQCKPRLLSARSLGVQEETRKEEAAALAREKKAAKKARRKERDAAVKAVTDSPADGDPAAAPAGDSGAQGSQLIADAAAAGPAAVADAAPVPAQIWGVQGEKGRRAEAEAPSLDPDGTARSSLRPDYQQNGGAADEQHGDEAAAEWGSASSGRKKKQPPAPETAKPAEAGCSACC